jgi:methionyl-tRNA formyltransferase
MNILISKDNSWSNELFNLLKSDNFIWLTELNKNTLDYYNPEWIFFFHWSDIVPESIFTKYKCVVTHTGNLPEGRGGSPLQNQILDGIVSSQVNLIEMCNEIDGGGIYCSAPVTLQGNLDDIWRAITKITFNLITKCASESPIPTPQKGTPKIYKRRKTTKIDFGNSDNLSYIYDQIRMLDSDDYQKSHIEIGDFVLEFSRAKMNNNKILADVIITKK